MLSAVLLFFVPVITGGSGSVGASTALDDVCGGMGGYYVTRGARRAVPGPGPVVAVPRRARATPPRPGSLRPTPPQPETGPRPRGRGRKGGEVMQAARTAAWRCFPRQRTTALARWPPTRTPPLLSCPPAQGRPRWTLRIYRNLLHTTHVGSIQISPAVLNLPL
jgi:hypothetical protein